jgi:phosphonate transport system permease protein
VLGLLLLGALSFVALGLEPAGLVPHAGGARIARDFLAAAVRPALDHEGRVPPGARPFLLGLLDALRRTVVFAAASMSLGVVGGAILGFAASSGWWSPAVADARGRPARLAPALQVAARVVIALLRSVHELLFAVVFLAAFGINTAGAVLALALPFSGVLAKVFSELFDEAPPDAGRALQMAGATPARAFLAGTLPRALPDMAAYAFYRFECAVRSSAVLGFFGFETLGRGLELSFANLHYREVWSYLYALLLLVLLLEAWSASLRRRFVA